MVNLLKSPIKKSVVDSLSIFQENNTQCLPSGFIYPSPSPNASIRLNNFEFRIFYYLFNPFNSNIATIWSFMYVQKVLRKLHKSSLNANNFFLHENNVQSSKNIFIIPPQGL